MKGSIIQRVGSAGRAVTVMRRAAVIIALTAPFAAALMSEQLFPQAKAPRPNAPQSVVVVVSNPADDASYTRAQLGQ